MELEYKAKLKDLMAMANIAEVLGEPDLLAIGSRVVADYTRDKQSRAEWEIRMANAMKLALQVVEAKSFPWPNAANIKFPLITIAALQFHARAYPALIPGKDIVKCIVGANDEDGEKEKRATRVQNHMSYQLLEEDEAWEDQTDKVLITVPIVGCAFKKCYRSAKLKHNVSEMVLASDLVVDYWAKSLPTAQCVTHVLPMNKNDIHERTARGLFLDVELSGNPQTPQDTIDETRDKAQGVSLPQNDVDTPFEMLEQHRYLDLDGDGYAEPYIVTVHAGSQKVVRIVANYFESGIERSKRGDVICIIPEQYFVKYSFIPSPDGGFYDLGFGALLGPLNESINTLINQLVDAGTMSNTAGGFLGRGVKIKGGNYSFTPLEWKHVESTGDDLRKGIVPLTVREPSQVLFTLLSLLIDYGERVGSATEAMVGVNPGQNTPAETSRNMIEQGMKIFSGIFKRVYRSLKEELRLLYRLNQLYLDREEEFAGKKVLQKDYQSSPRDISPAADPNVVSDSQRIQQAIMTKEAASNSPLYDKYQVEKRFLKAIKTENVEEILPDPNGPKALPPSGPDPMVQIEQLKAQTDIQIEQMKSQTKMQAEEMKFRTTIMELLQEAEFNQAKIAELQSKAVENMAQAKGAEAGQLINAINTQIALEKGKFENKMQLVEKLLKVVELKIADKEKKQDGDTGGVQ